MTLLDYYTLLHAESPFLLGTDYTVGDIAVFLWLLLEDKNQDRKEFVNGIKDIKIVDAEKDILTYLDEVFSECDTLQEKQNGKSHASSIAYQVDLYAREYGWQAEEILNLPMSQIFQLNTVIAERYSRENNRGYSKLRKVDTVMLEQMFNRTTDSN
jgi:hypothetical protein